MNLVLNESFLITKLMISVCSMEYYNHSIRKHFESFCSDMALMHLPKYSICPPVEGQLKRTMNLHYYIHAMQCAYGFTGARL